MPAETLNALKAAADKMANWTNAPLDDADELEPGSKTSIGYRASAIPSSSRSLNAEGTHRRAG